MLYIGIDLGTSACKFLLVDEAGAVKNTVTKEYPLFFPHPGWSEQDPADWWNACLAGIPELLEGFDAAEVAGIGAGGQMHGLRRALLPVRRHDFRNGLWLSPA